MATDDAETIRVRAETCQRIVANCIAGVQASTRSLMTFAPKRAFLRRRLALILNKSSSILPLSRVILISDVKMMRGKVVQLPPLGSPRKPQPNTESAVNMTLMLLAACR